MSVLLQCRVMWVRGPSGTANQATARIWTAMEMALPATLISNVKRSSTYDPLWPFGRRFSGPRCGRSDMLIWITQVGRKETAGSGQSLRKAAI